MLLGNGTSLPFTKDNVPSHVAVIMDGNGRWARSRNLPRLEGHRRGADVARNIVEWAADAHIRQISLYAFSTENWERPQDEVNGLMALLATILTAQLGNMRKKGVRLRILGDMSALPTITRTVIQRTVAATAEGERIDFILCLNYGGQQEIVDAARTLARQFHEGSITEEALDSFRPEDFRRLLWRDTLLPVDLLIRTGGECRISNFHLWDAAYAELYFSDLFWPDYNKEAFYQAIAAYSERERRFGLTSAQIKSKPSP
ncbi:MAG: polyprenyl diphosphate synthase [Mariprofundaceae bacterium]|nr:polyprenyl diphosphate synthase [Mariprofundaceae bacterium]